MMHRVLYAALFAATTIAAATPAHAQTAADAPASDDPVPEAALTESEQPDLEADEEEPTIAAYRVWASQADTPELAGEEERGLGVFQTLRGHGRFSFPQITLGTFSLVGEFDALVGQIAGDDLVEPPDGADSGAWPRGGVIANENTFVPRMAYAEWLTPVGQLQVGLQTSSWGLGILANDGAFDAEGLFNQNFGGDRVIRAIFATAPLRPVSASDFAQNFYVAVGGDLVLRDENASLSDGDQAWQGVLAATYRTEPLEGGTYLVYRNQTDDDGDTLEIFGADIFAEKTWEAGPAGWGFRAAGEGSLLVGETTRTLAVRSAEPVDLAALGVALESDVRYEPGITTLRLKAGYASGDANADDDTLFRFRFDPNYDVGLVLFDYFLPAVSRDAVRRIADPTRSGQPPKGVEGLVNDGAIENAYYLNPQLLFGHEDGLLTGVGVLYAWAPEPVMDPFLSFESGGVPTGVGGGAAGHELGLEADAAIRYRFNPFGRLVVEAKGEFGILFPGDAFDDAFETPAGPQSLGRVRLALSY